MRFSREEIIEKLNKKRQAGNPVIAASLGTGLLAKVADAAGVDLIILSSRGQYRANGVAACGAELAYVNSNDATWEAGINIIDKVKHTPVIGGVGVADPYRDMNQFVDELLTYGFSGVVNEPSTAGWEGHFTSDTAYNALGFPEEVKFMAACRQRNIFTMGICSSARQAQAMTGAGADVVCIDLGTTIGGMQPMSAVETKEQAIKRVGRIFNEIKKENMSCTVLFHGGPFPEPEDIRWVLENTGVHGVLAGSAIERIPVERAVTDCISRIRNSKGN